jgi:hypothetical protein
MVAGRCHVCRYSAYRLDRRYLHTTVRSRYVLTFDLADSFRRSLRSRNLFEHTILSRDVERGLELGLGIEL